jgi:hypothetical protein
VFSINCFNFWVYPQRLIYIGRRFGTLYRVQLQSLGFHIYRTEEIKLIDSVLYSQEFCCVWRSSAVSCFAIITWVFIYKHRADTADVTTEYTRQTQ